MKAEEWLERVFEKQLQIRCPNCGANNSCTEHPFYAVNVLSLVNREMEKARQFTRAGVKINTEDIISRALPTKELQEAFRSGKEYFIGENKSREKCMRYLCSYTLTLSDGKPDLSKTPTPFEKPEGGWSQPRRIVIAQQRDRNLGLQIQSFPIHSNMAVTDEVRRKTREEIRREGIEIGLADLDRGTIEDNTLNDEQKVDALSDKLIKKEVFPSTVASQRLGEKIKEWKEERLLNITR